MVLRHCVLWLLVCHVNPEKNVIGDTGIELTQPRSGDNENMVRDQNGRTQSFESILRLYLPDS